MSKDSSTKYYCDNQKRLQKKLIKDIKPSLKKEKRKSEKMVVKDINIYKKRKNKCWLAIEKNTAK